MSQKNFLNVQNSLTDRPWRARVAPSGEAEAIALVQQAGIGEVLARVLAGRGVTVDGAVSFLSPALRELLPDPSALRAMDAAVARLARAVEARETVAIFGDYDVDGACSAALMGLYLEACGLKPLIHIPDRVTEGYGPNREAIANFARQGATLLTTVDCGSTSHEVFADARSLCLDIIVFDHHLAPEILPDAIVVNPNRQDDLSGQGSLCAAGVVYLALIALQRLLRNQKFWNDLRPAPDLLSFLDLVALATVADVSPLTGLNRAFVHKGLLLMRRRERVGLTALMDVSRIGGPPQAWHLGFALGPRINAGGRIGDAALGARLLMTSEPDLARDIAAQLDALNAERRRIEAALLEMAFHEVSASGQDRDDNPLILVSGEDWPLGVVGLAAARLKEKFGRPAFAFAFLGDQGTGSGRSISGVDLGAAVRSAAQAGILLKGGGHKMAAGATLTRENLGPFRLFLEERLGQSVAIARRDRALLIDAALSARGLTRELVEDIERAGPFGASAPEPVFALPGHILRRATRVGADHLRLDVAAPHGGSTNIIAFRAMNGPLGPALAALEGEALHFAVALSLDRYGGATRVQARLVDAAKVV